MRRVETFLRESTMTTVDENRKFIPILTWHDAIALLRKIIQEAKCAQHNLQMRFANNVIC